MLDNPAAVAREVHAELKAQDRLQQEAFFVVGLDTRNGLRAMRMICVGTLDRCPTHPREVFTAALKMGGVARIILAHNHPSGDPSPSPQDITLTRAMVEAGRVLGIAVLDHIVVGTDDAEDACVRWHSLRESGMVEFDG